MVPARSPDCPLVCTYFLSWIPLQHSDFPPAWSTDHDSLPLWGRATSRLAFSTEPGFLGLLHFPDAQWCTIGARGLYCYTPTSEPTSEREQRPFLLRYGK